MENNNIAENSGTQMVTPEPTYMLIAMDNAVVFPGHLTSLSVGKQSADALVNAAAVGGEVFFVYSPSVGDSGMPVVLKYPESASAKAFESIVDKVVKTVN